MNLLQFVVLVCIALQVMRMTRRKEVGHKGEGYAAISKTILQQYGPEMCGLMVVLAVALILQTHGSMMTISTAQEERSIRSIASRWPTLLTGDALLGLQAMLRFL